MKARSGGTFLVSTQELIEKAGKKVNPEAFLSSSIEAWFTEHKDFFACSPWLKAQQPVVKVTHLEDGFTVLKATLDDHADNTIASQKELGEVLLDNAISIGLKKILQIAFIKA